MTLAPASFVMVSRIDGCLPSQAATRVFAVAFTTLATSDNRKMAPLLGLMHQRAVLPSLPHLAVDADRFGRLRALESAKGLEHIGAANGRVDILAGQASSREPDRVEAGHAPPAFPIR